MAEAATCSISGAGDGAAGCTASGGGAAVNTNGARCVLGADWTAENAGWTLFLATFRGMPTANAEG